MASGCAINSLLAEVFLFVSFLLLLLWFFLLVCLFVVVFFFSLFVGALSLSQASHPVFVISFSFSYQHFEPSKDAATKRNRIIHVVHYSNSTSSAAGACHLQNAGCYHNSNFLLELCLELTT